MLKKIVARAFSNCKWCYVSYDNLNLLNLLIQNQSGSIHGGCAVGCTNLSQVKPQSKKSGSDSTAKRSVRQQVWLSGSFEDNHYKGMSISVTAGVASKVRCSMTMSAEHRLKNWFPFTSNDDVWVWSWT